MAAFSDYIIYVDESGDHGLVSIDPGYPVFVLAFCIFHKQEYTEHVIPSLQRFKFKHFGHDMVVLHEREIRKDKGMFRFLQSKEQDDKITYVVFEKRGNREDNDLELEFRRVCDRANWFGCHLPFDIVFASKKINSGGLQFADLVARPVGLSILRPGQRNRAFDVLKEKFYCDSNGNRNGWGLKCFP